jgi:hypothetical protein
MNPVDSRRHMTLVQFCPACESAAVQVPDSVSLTLTCDSCGHTGPRESFPVHPFRTSAPMTQEVFQNLSDSLAHALMAGAHEQIGAWLYHWGFTLWDPKVPPRDRQEVQSRLSITIKYARAMGEGMLRGLFKARMEIEKERTRGN